ncbi:MAG TPA: glycosyltransferase family 2 protein, partial [Rhodobacterales bacterium]|nr:glycosyltransferase family 2 protein [Rhodobacterales bacterium]
MSQTRISCIIPAYNEGARIGAVLQAVAGHPMIDEVLVIDDASRDNTAEVAAQFATGANGVTLIRQPQNGGKTKALATGFAAMRGTHVLLLDADLIGLTAADVTALIAPVMAGEADMTISLRGNSPWPWR